VILLSSLFLLRFQDYKTAVEEYATAVREHLTAVEEYDTAANLVNEHARTRQAEASNIDQNRPNRIQRLTAATVVDKATALHATAKTVIMILDFLARLNNGCEHTRQSASRQASSNPAPRTAPQKTNTMTTKTFDFPRER
jgi:hypothetical protein